MDIVQRLELEATHHRRAQDPVGEEGYTELANAIREIRRTASLPPEEVERFRMALQIESKRLLRQSWVTHRFVMSLIQVMVVAAAISVGWWLRGEQNQRVLERIGAATCYTNPSGCWIPFTNRNP